MSNLYSQPWFLNEIEKIKSQNLKNLKIDHHKIKLLLQFFMKLDSRDPLKISNENWLYKILKNLEKEPFSLEKNFIDFNRYVDIPVNFDEYLFYLRSYDEYKTHLDITFLSILGRKKEVKNLDNFLASLENNEIAKKLNISHKNYLTFIKRKEGKNV